MPISLTEVGVANLAAQPPSGYGTAKRVKAGPLNAKQSRVEMQAATMDLQQEVNKGVGLDQLKAYQALLETLIGTMKEPTAPKERVTSVVAPAVIDPRDAGKQLAAAGELSTFYNQEDVYNTQADPNVVKNWMSGKMGVKLFNSQSNLINDIDARIAAWEDALKKQAATSDLVPTEQPRLTGYFPATPGGMTAQTPPLATGGSIADSRAGYIKEMQQLVSNAKQQSSYVPVFGYY